jgi:hypothetical protein
VIFGISTRQRAHKNKKLDWHETVAFDSENPIVQQLRSMTMIQGVRYLMHRASEQRRFIRVANLATELPSTICLALTATSAVAQVETLLDLARMPSTTCIMRCSCDRSNFYIEIMTMLDLKSKTKETKFQHDSCDMFKRFNNPDRPQTIFFVISKKEAENLCKHH